MNYFLRALCVCVLSMGLSQWRASACSTCLAGRGSADSFAGGVVAVGGMAPNPFHSTPSLETDLRGGYAVSPAPSTFALSNPQSFHQYAGAPTESDAGAQGLTRLLSGQTGVSWNQPQGNLAGQLNSSTLHSSDGSNSTGSADLAADAHAAPSNGINILPEPASIGLLCIGVIGLLHRRR